MLHETGDASAAQEVLIAKDIRQRQARREALWKNKSYGAWGISGVSDKLMGWTARYWWQPLRAFWALAALAIIGSVLFDAAARGDAIKPNIAVVIRSAEWAACAPDYAPAQPSALGRWRGARGETQRACFERQAEAASYPRFNALVYSLDTLLPIVDMEMQEYWIPDETKGVIGPVARVYLWIHIGLGWALSLLAVAGFSGLIKQDSRA